MGFKDRDIVDLLTLYGVTDEAQREELRGLASRANSPGWWQDYSDILASWFEEYLGLEEAAVQICTYEAQFVPGLLQTEDYARAVILLEYSNPKEINRRVSLRIARQAILSGPKPTSLWAVLDEAALKRPIGGARAMRAQLKHLIEMSQQPNVTIQIMPFTAGGHAAAGGSFSVLHFAEDDLPDMVYLEQLASAQYLDRQRRRRHVSRGAGSPARRGGDPGGQPRRRSGRRSARAESRRTLCPLDQPAQAQDMEKLVRRGRRRRGPEVRRTDLVSEPLYEDYGTTPPTVDGIVEEAWPSPAHVADPMLFFNAAGDPGRLASNIDSMLTSVTACLDLARLRSSTMSEYLMSVL